MESNSYGFCLKGCEGNWKGPRCAKKAATGFFTETSYIHHSNNRHCCSIRISFFPEKDGEQFSALAAERILFCKSAWEQPVPFICIWNHLRTYCYNWTSLGLWQYTDRLCNTGLLVLGMLRDSIVTYIGYINKT